MKSKLKAMAWTAAAVVVGVIVAVLAAKWGDENDIPILQDVYDVLN